MRRAIQEIENNVERKISTWAITFRLPFFLFSLLLIILASLGAQNFQLNGSPRIYFGPDNLNFQKFEILEQHYGRGHNVMFMLGPKDKQTAEDGKAFLPERLQALSDITESGWELPYAIRSQSIINYKLSTFLHH